MPQIYKIEKNTLRHQRKTKAQAFYQHMVDKMTNHAIRKLFEELSADIANS